MSTYVKEIIRIDNATGNIKSISLAPVNPPVEGVEGNVTIKHLMSDFTFPEGCSTNIEFMENYYWNFASETWVAKSPRPNYLATWSGTEWIWEEDAFWTAVRQIRNDKLLETDWMTLPDSRLSESQRNEIYLYRQLLRDITYQALPADGNLDSLSWPSKPTFL